MEEKQLKELIEKCLAGDATEEEQQMLEAWYQSFDAEPGVLEQLDEQEQRATGDRILSGINETIKQPPAHRHPPTRFTWLAAASVLLLIAGWFFYQTTNNQKKSPETAWVNIAGRNEEISSDTLPDGSLVWLHGSSSLLRYRNHFTNEKREVWLSGEGYFDVKPEHARPFIVHTGDVSTRVLGTAFNIHSGTRQRVVITVTRGRVAVENKTGTLGVLDVNDQIDVDLPSQKFRLSHVDALTVTSWKNPALVFREKRFADIASALEKKFGIKIVFSKDGIKNCLLTATFNPDVSGAEILGMLCKINGYQLRSRENVYTVSGQPCKE